MMLHHGNRKLYRAISQTFSFISVQPNLFENLSDEFSLDFRAIRIFFEYHSIVQRQLGKSNLYSK